MNLKNGEREPSDEEDESSDEEDGFGPKKEKVEDDPVARELQM